MGQPSSVLLIKLRHHGDVLLATPVARTLRAYFPKCQVDFLVYAETEKLLEDNPDVRDVFIWHRVGKTWSRWKRNLRLFLQLRRRRYDCVIHLSDQMQGALLAKFLRPQQSIGIDYPKRRHFFWQTCFLKLAPLFSSDTRHSVEQNLETLKHLSLPLVEVEKQDPYADHCRLIISREDRKYIHKRLQQIGITTPYLLIHPSARWFFKCWEDDRFAKVIEYFASRGWPVLLTSGPSEAEQGMVRNILHEMYIPRVYSLAGQLTLKQLAAAIDGSRLFVGVDSVPMHIAAALKKDVVALFGASKVNEWHPWKTRCRLLKATDYGSSLDPDDVKTVTSERYLSAIPVSDVIQAMEEMLTKTTVTL
jgi:heptosyltransferase-3